MIQYFADEYKAGRTPNPCVLCNQNLKFGRLIERADQLGAQYVATGHFARVERSPDGARTLLKRGRDLRKDQSYFLFSLRQEQLARALFPLGEKTKTDTRAWSPGTANSRPPTRKRAWKSASCRTTTTASSSSRPSSSQKHRGEIVNLQGQVLGEHDGIEFYTIGQRQGLGISSPKPLYVIELDAASEPRGCRGRLGAGARRVRARSGATGFAFDAPPAAFEATGQNPL